MKSLAIAVAFLIGTGCLQAADGKNGNANGKLDASSAATNSTNQEKTRMKDPALLLREYSKGKTAGKAGDYAKQVWGVDISGDRSQSEKSRE